MFKSYHLKRQLKRITQLKLQEVKNQNFSLAADYRDKEKEILKKLTYLKRNSIFKKIIRYFLRIIKEV